MPHRTFLPNRIITIDFLVTCCIASSERSHSLSIPSSIQQLCRLYIDITTIQQCSIGMSNEIIHLQFGQCGNQIGNVFWNRICTEHQIAKHDGKYTGNPSNYNDQLRSDKIDVYFNEAGTRRFVPRAVLIDLEPGTIDAIKYSETGSLFKPDNFCFGASGAGNWWAKGHYTKGAELIDEVVDITRKEAELCDRLQGFQLCHSLGGGTGSGMGTLMLLKIRDNYTKKHSSTFSVFPSPKVSDVVVEPYNATLAIHQLLETCDETFLIDNDALFSIAHNVLKCRQPRYHDLNWVISLAMADVTASFRYVCELNSDLRKMGINLVNFPRLHFLMLSSAPLFRWGTGGNVRLTVQELTDQMWSNRNFLASVKSEDGKYMSVACMYRGMMGQSEIIDEMAKIKQKMSDDFVTWIPDNVKSELIKVAPEYSEMSGMFLSNTTAIKGVFQRISAQFAKMYKRKAFLHQHGSHGMDEMEFQEADKNVRDLITEYQDKQDVVVEIEDEDDYDDEEDEESEYGDEYDEEEDF